MHNGVWGCAEILPSSILSLVKFLFSLVLFMLMYDNEYETKEKKLNSNIYNNNFKIKHFHVREDMNLNEFADFGSYKYIWPIKTIDDSSCIGGKNWTHSIYAECVFKIYAVYKI